MRALGGPAALLERASALPLSGVIQIFVSSPRVAFNLKNGALRMGFSGRAGLREAAQFEPK